MELAGLLPFVDGLSDLAEAARTMLGAVQSAPDAAPQAVPIDVIDAAPAGEDAPVPVTDFSMWHMFMMADWVVKSVMIVLVAASFWSWAIMIDKWLAFRGLRARADKFEQVFWSGRSLDDLHQKFALKPDHPMAVVFAAGMREWRRSTEGGDPPAALVPNVKERIDTAMNVTIAREMEGVEKRIGFLATVGSTAPFIGLFGTVWGIMNSFRAIAVNQDTNLAVVAPGIAEALFATALGLLAAIPAVVFYNKFVQDSARYAGRLEGFADEFSAILSRLLDERAR